ncbi:MAG: methyltransferase domain-containing protein [Candidatus Theseobacter exili]|nr:methyltransferase domain-containing protein [Candidatus Theseobacter exili]
MFPIGYFVTYKEALRRIKNRGDRFSHLNLKYLYDSWLLAENFSGYEMMIDGNVPLPDLNTPGLHVAQGYLPDELKAKKSEIRKRKSTSRDKQAVAFEREFEDVLTGPDGITYNIVMFDAEIESPKKFILNWKDPDEGDIYLSRQAVAAAIEEGPAALRELIWHEVNCSESTWGHYFTIIAQQFDSRFRTNFSDGDYEKVTVELPQSIIPAEILSLIPHEDIGVGIVRFSYKAIKDSSGISRDAVTGLPRPFKGKLQKALGSILKMRPVLIERAKPEQPYNERLSEIFHRQWSQAFRIAGDINNDRLSMFWAEVFGRLDSEGYRISNEDKYVFRRLFSAKRVRGFISEAHEDDPVLLANAAAKISVLIGAFHEKEEDLNDLSGLSLSELVAIVDLSFEDFKQDSKEAETELTDDMPSTGMVILTGVGGDIISSDAGVPYSRSPRERFSDRFFMRQGSRRGSIAVERKRGLSNTFRDFAVLFKKDQNDPRNILFRRDRNRALVDRVKMINILFGVEMEERTKTVSLDYNERAVSSETGMLIHYAGYTFLIYVGDPKRLFVLTDSVEKQLAGYRGAKRIQLRVKELSSEQLNRMLTVFRKADQAELWTDFLKKPGSLTVDDHEWPDVLQLPQYKSAKKMSDEAILKQLDAFTDGMTTEEVSRLRILDLACGDGSLIGQVIFLLKNKFPGLDLIQIEGIDRNRTFVDKARSAGLNVSVGNAKDLSRYPDGSFDVVIAESLYTEAVIPFEDAEPVLREIHRVTKPVPTPENERENLKRSEYVHKLIQNVKLVRQFVNSQDKAVDHLWSDQSVIETFLKLNVQPGETVLEVGPGHSLTGILCALMGAKVVVVEHPDMHEMYRQLGADTFPVKFKEFKSAVDAAGGSIDYLTGDITNPAYAKGLSVQYTEAFDHIIATDVLRPNPKTLENDLKLIRQALRFGDARRRDSEKIYHQYLPRQGVWKAEKVNGAISLLMKLKKSETGTFYISHPESHPRLGENGQDISGFDEALRDDLRLASFQKIPAAIPRADEKLGRIYVIGPAVDLHEDAQTEPAEEDEYTRKLRSVVRTVRSRLQELGLPHVSDLLWTEDDMMEVFSSMEIKPGEKVLEIGPMHGVVSIVAAMMGGNVTAIEHPDSIQVLNKLFNIEKVVDVFIKDIKSAGGRFTLIKQDVVSPAFIERFTEKNKGLFDHVIATDVLRPDQKYLEMELAQHRPNFPDEAFEKLKKGFGIWKPDEVKRVVKLMVDVKNGKGSFYISHIETLPEERRDVTELDAAIEQSFSFELQRKKQVAVPYSNFKKGYVYNIGQSEEQLYREKLQGVVRKVREYIDKNSSDHAVAIYNIWSEEKMIDTFMKLNIHPGETVLEIGPVMDMTGIIAAMMGADVTVLEHPDIVEVSRTPGMEMYEDLIQEFRNEIESAEGKINYHSGNVTDEGFIKEFSKKHNDAFDYVIATDVLRLKYDEFGFILVDSKERASKRDIARKTLPLIGIIEPEELQRAVDFILNVKRPSGGAVFVSFTENHDDPLAELPLLLEGFSNSSKMKIKEKVMAATPKTDREIGFIYRVSSKAQPMAAWLGKALNKFASGMTFADISNEMTRFSNPDALNLLSTRINTVKVREALGLSAEDAYALGELLRYQLMNMHFNGAELSKVVGGFNHDKFAFPAILSMYIDSLMGASEKTSGTPGTHIAQGYTPEELDAKKAEIKAKENTKRDAQAIALEEAHADLLTDEGITYNIIMFDAEIESPKKFVLNWKDQAEKTIYLSRQSVAAAIRAGPAALRELIWHEVHCDESVWGHYFAIVAQQHDPRFKDNYPEGTPEMQVDFPGNIVPEILLDVIPHNILPDGNIRIKYKVMTEPGNPDQPLFDESMADASGNPVPRPFKGMLQPALSRTIRMGSFFNFARTYSSLDGTHFDYPPFLISNEQYGPFLKILGDNSEKGGIFAGVSFEQNMSYILAQKPELAVITDRNRTVSEVFLPVVSELACASSSRLMFLAVLFGKKFDPEVESESEEWSFEKILDYLDSQENYENPMIADIIESFPAELKETAYKFWVHNNRFGMPGIRISEGGIDSPFSIATYRKFIARIATGLDSSLHWLGNEENFQKIQTYFRNGKIVGISGDWGLRLDTSVLQLSQDAGLPLNLVAFSNITEDVLYVRNKALAGAIRRICQRQDPVVASVVGRMGPVFFPKAVDYARSLEIRKSDVEWELMDNALYLLILNQLNVAKEAGGVFDIAYLLSMAEAADPEFRLWLSDFTKSVYERQESSIGRRSYDSDIRNLLEALVVVDKTSERQEQIVQAVLAELIDETSITDAIARAGALVEDKVANEDADMDVGVINEILVERLRQIYKAQNVPESVRKLADSIGPVGSGEQADSALINMDLMNETVRQLKGEVIAVSELDEDLANQLSSRGNVKYIFIDGLQNTIFVNELSELLAFIIERNPGDGVHTIGSLVLHRTGEVIHVRKGELSSAERLHGESLAGLHRAVRSDFEMNNGNIELSAQLLEYPDAAYLEGVFHRLQSARSSMNIGFAVYGELDSVRDRLAEQSADEDRDKVLSAFDKVVSLLQDMPLIEGAPVVPVLLENERPGVSAIRLSAPDLAMADNLPKTNQAIFLAKNISLAGGIQDISEDSRIANMIREFYRTAEGKQIAEDMPLEEVLKDPLGPVQIHAMKNIDSYIRSLEAIERAA